MKLRTAAAALGLSTISLIGPVTVPAANAATCHMSAWKGFSHWHPGTLQNFNIFGRAKFRVCGRGATITGRLKYIQGAVESGNCETQGSPFGRMKYVNFRFEVPYGSPRAGDKSTYRYVWKVPCEAHKIHWITRRATTPQVTYRSHDDWHLHMHANIRFGNDQNKDKSSRIFGDL